MAAISAFLPRVSTSSCFSRVSRERSSSMNSV